MIRKNERDPIVLSESDTHRAHRLINAVRIKEEKTLTSVTWATAIGEAQRQPNAPHENDADNER